ncbi:MAG TPA: LPS assembly lipoprotein LptE [Candidatus Eisenbacteria bacterium]
MTRPRPQLLLLPLAVLLATTLTGCYTVRNSIPDHIKSIAVPVFRNESLQSGVEDEITRKVIATFQSSNALPIADAATANALVDGVVKSYENKVYRIDAQEQAQEYIVIITSNVLVKDRVKNKELWSEEGIRVTATYAVVGPTVRTEAEARSEAVDQLADIIRSRTVEGW